MKLVSKKKVRYWMLQLAGELNDRLKSEEDKVIIYTNQTKVDFCQGYVIFFPTSFGFSPLSLNFVSLHFS